MQARVTTAWEIFETTMDKVLRPFGIDPKGDFFPEIILQTAIEASL